jgi:hypothetical protein
MHLNAQCGGLDCRLYVVDSKCSSQCNTCGTLCESFPITDASSAQLYSTKGCTVIVGDLYIMNLPVAVTRTVLFKHLKDIRHIHGVLHFKDNHYLSAMTFLSNVVSIYGAVYTNNPGLLDARLFSLTSLRDGVSVEGCDRLCPARFTAVGSTTDDSECPNPQLEYFMHVEGSMTASDLGVLSSVMARVVRNVTIGEVSGIVVWQH